MILRFSYFEGSSSGHGGQRRSAQIIEILKANKCEYNNFVAHWESLSYKKKVLYFLLGLKISYLTPGVLKKIRTINAFGRFGFFFTTLKRQYSSCKLLILESSFAENYILVEAAKQNRIKIIACPHNLESLVKGQKSSLSGKKSPFWFEEEISLLSKCDAVFTISREENWLLRIFGINSFFLPYYPDNQKKEQLLSIRKKREKKINVREKIILLLGSAANFPTNMGIRQLIGFWLNSKEKLSNIHLHIAGYGTEVFYEEIKDVSSIFLHGSVSEEKLDDLLTNASVAIINQKVSSGALTKIPEYLLAGIPVIINEDAARSFFNLDGIYTYSNFIELIDLLGKDIPPPSVFNKSLNYETFFVSQVKEFLSDEYMP